MLAFMPGHGHGRIRVTDLTEKDQPRVRSLSDNSKKRRPDVLRSVQSPEPSRRLQSVVAEWNRVRRISYVHDRNLGMATIDKRITTDPHQCGGRPCVRGMRVRVTDVLDLLANGLTPSQVIDEMPYLELPDIEACLRFASRRIDHPVISV